MIAPIEKIKSLTTEDVQTLFGEDVLNVAFEEAFKFVNSLITDNACYEALVSSASLSDGYKTILKNISTGNKLGWNDDDFLRNRRILYVNRRLSGSTYISASKIAANISTTNATVDGSIYYENDNYNPKYYSTDTGALEILPDASAAIIYFMTYPRFGESNRYNDTHQLYNVNFSDVPKEAEVTLFYGIPTQARELVYIQMALNLIQYYMSDFVHEEEDTELSNLLGAQVVSLDRDKKEHLQFVVSSFGNDQLGEK